MALSYAENIFKPNFFQDMDTSPFTTTDHLGSNNAINSLDLSTYKKEFGNLGLISYANIPDSHKRAADSYVLVRQVFGTPVVHSALTDDEAKLLTRFDFYPLEFTTSKQIEQELLFLRKWSLERDRNLRAAADEVIKIRCKELKHVIATNYTTVKRELYDGYKSLDKYFQDISKYNRKN